VFAGTLYSVVLVVMVVSLVLMVVIPVLPGQFLIWLAALGYGLLAGWEKLGWLLFLLLTAGMLAAAVIDLIAGWMGAKRGGASTRAIVMGFALGVIGLIVFNVFGALVGIFGGIVGYEYLQSKDGRRALKAGVGYLGGLLVSLVARFFIALGMVGLFARMAG